MESWRVRRKADRYVDLLAREEVGDIKGEVLELHYTFKESLLRVEEFLGGSGREQGGGRIELEGCLGILDMVAVSGDALGTGLDTRC